MCSLYKHRLKYIRSNFGDAEDLTLVDSEVQNDVLKISKLIYIKAHEFIQSKYIAHKISFSYVNCKMFGSN